LRGRVSEHAAPASAEQFGWLLIAEALAGPVPVTPAARLARRRAWGYFTRDAERMDCPLLRTDGLPFGSGTVESAAAHVVQQRLKRLGMCRCGPGAPAILTLPGSAAVDRSLPARPRS